jgi:hypothetical protein
MASAVELILMLRLTVAESAVGWVESVTLMVAEEVPAEPELGVPVMAPVVPLIESPAGSPLALKA